MSEIPMREAPDGETAMPEPAPPAKTPNVGHFAKKPLPPRERLDDVREKLAAGEVTLAVGARLLECSLWRLKKIAAENCWVVPPRSRARTAARAPGENSAHALPPSRPLTRANRARLLARASQASWRAIDALTIGLEKMIARKAGPDAIAKQTTSISKLVTDLRRNGLHEGDRHRSADANEQSGHAATDAADLAADMAGARARLVERFRQALGQDDSAENS